MSRLALRITTLALASLIASCATRSISNPERPWGNGNTAYAGELSDFDVVGSGAADQPKSDDLVLRPHMRVLLVQSGAAFPDERMITGLSKQFDVGAASGAPTPTLREQGMRYAAARGGFDAVIAYWGVLETTEHMNAGATVSWVPIAGAFVPDWNQRMRIRLRVVILDVHSGRWRTLLTPPIDDERASSILTREDSDSHQVGRLMQAAIPVAVNAITQGL
jgi:hypothetical protein